MAAENCRRGVSPAPTLVSRGPCPAPDTEEEECSTKAPPCSKIFSPVCGDTGGNNVTFTNECKLRAESCRQSSTRTAITVHSYTAAGPGYSQLCFRK